MTVEILDSRGAAVAVEGDIFLLEETRVYRIRAHGAREVWLSEEKLAALPSGHFEIQLGHYVGNLGLRVSKSDGTHAYHRLRVQPRADKLSPDIWVRLLEELEEGLGGVSTGVMGPTQGAVNTSGVSAQLLVSALLPLVPALVASLQAVIDMPRLIDSERLTERKLHECRRIDSSTLTWIGRHPEIGRWLDGWKVAELVDRPPLLPVHSPSSTLDHPANRYVAWLTMQVIGRLDKVADRLDTIARVIDEPVWCLGRAKRARLAANQIRQILDRSWLRAVRPEPASHAAILVVIDEPVYARFQRFSRRFCAPAFRLEEAEQDPGAAVRPSFSIYELWCFFALRRHLGAALPGWRWSDVNLKSLLKTTGSGCGAAFIASCDTRRLQIEFNPTFRSWYCRGSSHRHSLSSERRPDFVVTFDRGPGDGRWIILDAKYRVGKENLAKGLASVHIYRDALVDQARGGKCGGALLLAPSPCDVPEWFDPTWQRQQGLGILALVPGLNAPALIAWMREMLDLASTS